MSTKTQASDTAVAPEAASGSETLTVTDNRTGQSYEIAIVDGAIRSLDLRQIKTDEEDFGLLAYDPAFMNTASCRSAVTYLDGDLGVLEYRGYPIEQLAEHSTYLEVAYLLVHGELPTETELASWIYEIKTHTFVHENVKSFIQGFRHDAHPMGMLLGSVGALSTFYPNANEIHDADNRAIQTIRLIAKMPTLAAFSYRRAQVPARSATRPRARHPLHSPRRPRAELLDERGKGDRLLTRRPLLGGRRRHRRVVWPVARRRQRRGRADADPDRLEGEHP
jgi:hypothetical protein